MGQKITPFALRLGINQDWRSRWVAKKKDLALWIKEDALIRKTIYKHFTRSFIAKIEIERQNNNFLIFISTSLPGVILGQKGRNVELVVLKIKKILKNRNYSIKLEVLMIKNPGLNAQLVANDIAHRISNRENYRNLQREAVKSAVRLGAKGIKVTVAGRLNGSDIARTEHISQGKIPLSTLRADIDYGFAPSITTYGKIGVKVWIFQGIIFKTKVENLDTKITEEFIKE